MTAPHPLRPSRLAMAVGAALSLSCAQALSAERAGRVLATTGPVVARTDDGDTRSLARGSRIYSGDSILTHRGRVQIRFRDGGLVSLEPRTKFRVEQYAVRDEADDDGGSAIMRLFRGALRTVTGVIGDDPDELYRMETPVGTIGVRGTQYALRYCAPGDCGSDVAEGLYGHVIDKAVSVENRAGSARFPAGAYFNVPDGETLPTRILRPPGDVFRGAEVPDDDDAEDGEVAGGGVTGGGDDTPDSEPFGNGTDGLIGEFSSSTETGVETSERTPPDPEEPEEPEEPEDPGPAFTTLTPAAVGGALAGDRSGVAFSEGDACLSDTGCTAEIDDNGNLRVVDLGTLEAVDASSGVTLAESGSVGSVDATWGRWQGDIRIDDGTTEDTVDGSFAWAYSTNPTTTAELTAAFTPAGTLTFNTVGGPSPVGSINGTDWSVGTLQVAMDIGGGTATVGAGFNDVQLFLTRPGTDVDLINDFKTASVDPSSGDRGFTIDLVDSFGPDTAQLEALFAGDNAEGLVLEFEAMDDSTGEVIEGVKILTQ